VNGTQQLLFYANDVNISGENKQKTIKKQTETLLQTSRKVCLEVNTEMTKHKVVSIHQKAGQKSQSTDC